MCLNPRKIRNPTSFISRSGGQPLYLEVACGSCAECKKNKRLEYRFRSFHQIEDCVNNGGYVYFDTLTYSPKHLPMLSRYIDSSLLKKLDIEDFSCFCAEDWRNFLKNLRRQLDYHYGVKFKYFLSSEYGTDENYTHRPHYHILFFIDSKLIDPFKFSELVSSCWKFGRTDGLPYHDRKYVREHVFGYDVGQECHNDFLKACDYVSKYITKDSTFQKTIDNRLEILNNKLESLRYKKDISSRELYCQLIDIDINEIVRNINMFHRQSQGFGISFLKKMTPADYDDLVNTGTVKLIDKKKVVLTIPLPNYYKRHLFYKLHRDDEGKYYWVPTTTGLDYIQTSYQRNINNVADRYYKLYLNADRSERSFIDYLLNYRTFNDFATYLLLFRGRSLPFHGIDYSHKSFNRYSWLDNIHKSMYVRELTFTDLLFRDVDNCSIRIPLVKNTLFNNFIYTDLSYDTFISQNCINQDTCSDFHNFDLIYNLFKSIALNDNKHKQIIFEFLEELEQKFKHLKNYGY